MSTEHVGRPVKVYMLAKPFSDILEDFEHAKREQIDTIHSAINKVRTFT